jgi:hypothetical protein
MYAVDHVNPVSQDAHQFYLYFKKHGQEPPPTLRENVAAFASIRDEQSEYNAWFASHNCTAHAGENDSCEGIPACLPKHINDSGTLNLRTLKIPYYRNACTYASLVSRFERECLAVGAGNDAWDCSSLNVGHLKGATFNLRAASLSKVAAAIALQESQVDSLRPLTKNENYASYGYSSGYWPNQDMEDDHLELENLPGSFMAELDALQAAASEELSRAELLQDADAIQGGQ